MTRPKPTTSSAEDEYLPGSPPSEAPSGENDDARTTRRGVPSRRRHHVDVDIDVDIDVDAVWRANANVLATGNLSKRAGIFRHSSSAAPRVVVAR